LYTYGDDHREHQNQAGQWQLCPGVNGLLDVCYKFVEAKERSTPDHVGGCQLQAFARRDSLQSGPQKGQCRRREHQANNDVVAAESKANEKLGAAHREQQDAIWRGRFHQRWHSSLHAMIACEGTVSEPKMKRRSREPVTLNYSELPAAAPSLPNADPLARVLTWAKRQTES
jgi:hypothetical protein